MTASENASPASAQGPAPTDTRPAAERASSRPAKARQTRSFPWLGTGLAFALIVIVVLGAALWRQQQLVDAIGRESARRFNEIDSFARDAQARARQALSVSQGNTDRLAVLEAKVLESQSQQAALEQLYQELSRGEDEWTLIEVEQALAIAAQQLQLAGNVQNSIAALQVADARLARADRPQFTSVRRAIAQDLERLRSLPSVDVSGLVVKIDQLIALLDRVPLLAGVEPASAAAATAHAAPAGAAAGDEAAGSWWQRALAWWRPLRDGFVQDMRGLVRVQRVDRPEALLVSPEQGAMVRENLKLRLLNARLALLSRQEHAWQADLDAVGQALTTYFDAEAPATRSASTLLKQIRETDISIQLPTLNDSLAAVRSVLPRNAVPGAQR
ncbi:Putative uroporphyrinogen-III C-methyltransferase [Pigmentiphaga humi]|uniref:Uroporphyrinogen-III C-methyltransferase n=1 Tax=Pigmentiphaga humi TaxID=2478468 RepID=A0A3P4B285_9BURK|nr:uroporphyrinogen-III C-methyltransferase [Pigmentiphaga humi]VCU69265.1 Putative uroporphyrinogen-III C-methyltransferase [Pigmentiphaga humi]